MKFNNLCPMRIQLSKYIKYQICKIKYEIMGSKDARWTTLPPTFRVGPLALEIISLIQGGSVYRICCLICVEDDGKGNVSQACQYTSCSAHRINA